MTVARAVAVELVRMIRDGGITGSYTLAAYAFAVAEGLLEPAVPDDPARGSQRAATRSGAIGSPDPAPRLRL